MVRPKYETPEDLQREAEVAAAIEKAWSCRLVKTPAMYELDFAIVSNGAVKGFCEIKNRGKLYDEMILSAKKWMFGLEVTRSLNLPFFIIFRTPAGVFYTKGRYEPLKVTMAGRTDRGDAQDVEPCVMIPQSFLTRLNCDLPNTP